MSSRYRTALPAGLLVVSLVALAGCGKKAAVVVNGKAIPQERFINILEQAQGNEVLTELIKEELVLQEAEKEKVMPTDAEIKRRVEELQKQNPGAFSSVTPDDLRRRVAMQLAARNIAFKDIPKPTEDEMRKWFEANKSRLNQAEQVLAKRVVFAKREDAAKARDTLLQNVEFDVVADKSIDMPQIRGNDNTLPLIVRNMAASGPKFVLVDPRGQVVAGADGKPMNPDDLLGRGVTEKLFGLPEKGVTDVMPCPSPQGFEVIQVQKRQDAKAANYDELKERIGETVQLEALGKKEKTPPGVDPLDYFNAQLLNRLRANAKIEVKIDALKNVTKRDDLWPRISGAPR